MKSYLRSLVLLVSIVLTAPMFADARIDAELAGAAPEVPLKAAIGEKLYNEAMASGDYKYVGNGKCRICHREFFQGRKKDKHNFSMKSLEASGNEKNGRCVICHSTGNGVATGFTSKEETPKLENIGCEGCHGPGNVHAARAMKKETGGFLAGADNPDRVKKLCKACHTDRWNNSTGDFEKAYDRYRTATPE